MSFQNKTAWNPQGKVETPSKFKAGRILSTNSEKPWSKRLEAITNQNFITRTVLLMAVKPTRSANRIDTGSIILIGRFRITFSASRHRTTSWSMPSFRMEWHTPSGIMDLINLGRGGQNGVTHTLRHDRSYQPGGIYWVMGFKNENVCFKVWQNFF